MTYYYQCAECYQPITGDDIDTRHSRDDGEDVHVECCPRCNRAPVQQTKEAMQQVQCTRCLTWDKPAQPYGTSKSLVEGLDVILDGGYAQYYDPVDTPTVIVHLCHKCSNELIDFLGVYEHESFIGGHAVHGNPEYPCCLNCVYTDENGVRHVRSGST